MKVDRREQERSDLNDAIAGFARVLDDFDARIDALFGRKRSHPAVKLAEKNFAAEVVTAMKSIRISRF